MNPSPFAAYEHRLFVCHGLTRDSFCPPTGVLIQFDEYLQLHLKDLSYRQILFYSHQGLYFLDADSRDAVMGVKTGPVQPSMPDALKRLSPAGLSLRRRTPPASPAPDSGTSRWCFPDFPVTELIGIIRLVMMNPDVPTAVVFNSDHIESIYRNPATATYFRGMLETDIRSLPARNRNIMIFVFGMDPDLLFQNIQGKPWDILFQQGQGNSPAGELPGRLRWDRPKWMRWGASSSITGCCAGWVSTGPVTTGPFGC